MKKALIAVAVLVVGFIAVVSMQPDSYHVERSATINAPATVVWTEVADFRRWDAWSPWEKLDPEMKKSFTGEPMAVGSAYTWEGNADVGKGSMTVLEADAPTKFTAKLEFIEPFESVATTTHTFVPEGDGVKVTWAMDGNNDGFVAKFFSMMMDMDAMIGADYEKGLAALAKVSEESAKKVAAAADEN